MAEEKDTAGETTGGTVFNPAPSTPQPSGPPLTPPTQTPPSPAPAGGGGPPPDAPKDSGKPADTGLAARVAAVLKPLPKIAIAAPKAPSEPPPIKASVPPAGGPGVAESTKSAMPEPVILEEHVVEKAPPAKAPAQATGVDVGLKLPNSLPEIKMPSQADLQAGLVKPPAAAPVVAKMPPPPPMAAPATPAPVPPAMVAPPIPDAGLPPKPPSTDAIQKAAREASAQLPPTKNDSVIAPAGQSINTDIEKILREVKLPERRDFKGAADPVAPPAALTPQTPKDLSAMVVKPPTDADTAKAMVPDDPTKSAISSVHTLKDDLQHAVKEKKMSLVRAVSLEQDKKRTEFVEEDFGRRERRKRVAGILFATALLFVLGAAALGGVYFVMLSHSATDVQNLNSLVFAEQSAALPLDNANPSELKRRIAAERQSQTGSLGSITRIVPLYQGPGPDLQPREATTEEFFTAMGFNAPTDLLRSVSDVFFFGLHVVDENAPVLVIPIINFDRAFSGMLAWEHTMNSDLSPAFTPLPSVVLDANGIPSERIFRDNVMRNYDVREIKDDAGVIQLYYSFPAPNLLIIAESPYSFPELLSRLQSVRRL